MIGARGGTRIALLACTAALALTGCTAGTAPERPSPTPSPSFTWPAVSGRVLGTSDADGERIVRIAVRDPERADAEARALLVDAGVMPTKDRPGEGGGDGRACTPALCVQCTATTEREPGPNLLSEAFHSTGVVPLEVR